jgi:Icc-related predicted phosphoesterase
MKFLCVAEHIDSFVFSKHIKERFPNIDAVLCAGDVPLEYIDYLASAFEKPVFYVVGDHHFYTETKQLPIAQAVDFLCAKKTIAGKTVLIAGASGSLRHNNNPAQYTDSQMSLRLLALLPSLLFNKIRYGRYLDIFLTHVPPKDINDFEESAFRGFPCYKRFIERFKPKFHVHGHIHLYNQKDPRVTAHGSTTVVNASGHYVIEIDV